MLGAMALRWLALAALSGCAQLAGLEKTSSAPVDAASDSVDAPTDATVCVGGDARATDPATGRCYIYFATPSSRDSARTTCNALHAGSFLASVDGPGENSVIAAIIGTDALLGGTDELTEGVFVWDDGTPFGFTNWGVGQPDNGSTVEHCFVMLGSGGLWNDKPCAPGIGPAGTGSYAFVCEHQ